MSEFNTFDDDEDVSWFSEQQSLERDHPKIAENISEFRDWLMTKPGMDWLFDQFRLHRFRSQRRQLKDNLGILP